MKRKSIFLFLLFLVLTVVSACNFDFLNFENHLYNDFTSSEKLYLNELDSKKTDNRVARNFLKENDFK